LGCFFLRGKRTREKRTEKRVTACVVTVCVVVVTVVTVVVCSVCVRGKNVAVCAVRDRGTYDCRRVGIASERRGPSCGSDGGASCGGGGVRGASAATATAATEHDRRRTDRNRKPVVYNLSRHVRLRRRFNCFPLRYKNNNTGEAHKISVDTRWTRSRTIVV